MAFLDKAGLEKLWANILKKINSSIKQPDWNQIDESAKDFIKNKPMVTPAGIGALSTTGGNMTGDINFGILTQGLTWEMADGTKVYLRPDTSLNLFQVVLVPPNGTPFEAFGIQSDGTPTFSKPLGMQFGGTGANNAADALVNLGIIYSEEEPEGVAGRIWLKPI